MDETQAILADASLMDQIRESEKEIEAGLARPAAEVLAEIGE